MRILYGVVGEGMGHAVRSRVILDHLVEQGHELLIVVSGRAHRFLAERFAGQPRVRVEQIHGLHLAFDGNAVDVGDSITENLEELPRNLAVNSAVYRRVRELDFRPRAIISDFEYWAYLFGRLHGVPVISVDNMKIIDRCRHDASLLRGAEADFRLTRLAVRAKLAWAYHYLISSFFFPPICKPRTTLVPPILRPEVLALRREPGSHVLVYQSAANPGLLPLLQALPHPFRVYGMGRVGEESNVTLCPFSETAFLEDLRTARAVIAGGGYSLMGEAVHVGVPMLSVPLEGHFEQELNSRYLAQQGYGRFAAQLTAGSLREFLAHVPDYERALGRLSPPGQLLPVPLPGRAAVAHRARRPLPRRALQRRHPQPGDRTAGLAHNALQQPVGTGSKGLAVSAPQSRPGAPCPIPAQDRPAHDVYSVGNGRNPAPRSGIY